MCSDRFLRKNATTRVDSARYLTLRQHIRTFQITFYAHCDAGNLMLSIHARQCGTDTAANFAGVSNNISAKRKVKVDESSTFAFRKFLSNTMATNVNHAIEVKKAKQELEDNMND